MALHRITVSDFPVLVLSGYLFTEVKYQLLTFRTLLSRLLFVLSGQEGGGCSIVKMIQGQKLNV